MDQVMLEEVYGARRDAVETVARPFPARSGGH
jgi:hypothetical protein